MRNKDPHLQVPTRGVHGPAIFEPGQAWRWDALGEALQADGLVQNN